MSTEERYPELEKQLLSPDALEKRVWAKHEALLDEIIQHLRVRFNNGETKKIVLARYVGGNVGRNVSFTNDRKILEKVAVIFDRELRNSGWNTKVVKVCYPWFGPPYLALEVRSWNV